MSHGRNTQILTSRVADNIAIKIKAMAKRRRRTVSELIGILLSEFVEHPKMFQSPKLRTPKGPYISNFDELKTTMMPLIDLKNNSYEGTPRNAPCPCGSGEKYKRCHGR
jgi:hypothetical protein